MRNLCQIEDPKIIYKYRDWGREFHRKLLTDPSVYLSAPSDFEDKLDCKNPIRYDLLTDIEIFDIYYREAKSYHPNWSFKEWFEFAIKGYWQSPLKDPLQLEEVSQKYSKEFDERFGVLSLSGNPLSIPMWDKYGNNKKGFCVGYDNNLLFRFLGGGRLVDYVDTLPIIKPFQPYEIEHILQVFHKERKWEFEEEYRTHKFWDRKVSIEERNIQIEKDCIKEVIFGPYIEDSDRIEIENHVKNHLPHVKLISTEIKEDRINFCT